MHKKCGNCIYFHVYTEDSSLSNLHLLGECAASGAPVYGNTGAEGCDDFIACPYDAAEEERRIREAE